MNLANLIVQSLRLETFTCMVATRGKSKTENHTIDTIVASTDAAGPGFSLLLKAINTQSAPALFCFWCVRASSYNASLESRVT